MIVLRRPLLSLLGSLMMVLAVAASGQPRTSPPELLVPSTMAATGDSITVANDATKLLTPQPECSCSTGTATSVNSLYQRLQPEGLFRRA